MADTDPEIDAIRSIAVDPEAVVDAFIYTRENPGTAVLRVTPPFHGRMRARLHVFRDGPGTEAAYCRPTSLLPEEIVAAYPSLEDVAGDPDDADPDERRSAHADAIEDWRRRAEEVIADETIIERGDDRVRVDITVLG